MQIDPTIAGAASAVKGTAIDGSIVSKDKKTLNQNFDQFLVLLTTQLKNQDPLSPMKSNEFTNQLVSFSGVEQQIKMNKNISNLVKISKSSQTTLGLSYIGLKVNNPGSQFKYSGTGSSEISYNLPKDAARGTISILDKNGQSVYSQEPNLAKGTHKFIWDGLDKNGQPSPAGTYTVQVGAIDATQKSFSVSTIVPGIVEGIETTGNGDIMLLVNEQLVPMSEIKRARL